MNYPSRILIATDYSEAATNAAIYACRFAKAINASIALIHVYESPMGMLPVDHLAIEGKKAAFEETEQELLQMQKHRILTAIGSEDQEQAINCISCEGNAGDQIIKYAEEWGADIIVMGTHGASGFKERVFGSHTWKVIKNAKVPVLAIPLEVEFNNIHNIVFAAGERKGEIPSLNYVSGIAKKFDAKIAVIHVTDFAISKTFETEMFNRFSEEVKAKIDYQNIELYLEYNANIIEGIAAYCQRNEVQWLVMTHEKTSFLSQAILPIQSLTKKMSTATSLPLLCIPDFFNPNYRDFWRLFETDEKILNEVF